MKKVAGCRLRVAGCGCQGLAIGVLFLISGASFSVSSQEMRYKFKAGQVIQYEFQDEYERNDAQGIGRELYEFKVDSCSESGACMTMTIKQHSSKSAVFSYQGNKREENPHYYQSSIIDGYDNSTSKLEAPLLGDINRRIHFHISDYGQISRISGLDAILHAVLQPIRDHRWIKMSLHYNLLKIRYSEEFYKILIRQFFPPLPIQLDKSQSEPPFSLNHLGRTISFGFDWQDRPAETVNKTHYFDCPAIFHARDTIHLPYQELTCRMNEATMGISKWNSEKSLFESMRFKGINLHRLLFFWPTWEPSPGNNKDSVSFGSDQISISLIKATDQTTVRTKFKIINADSLVMSIIFPTGGIQSEQREEFIKGDSTILDIGIPIEKEAIVEVRIINPFSPHYSGANKIRFYAQPGDSMTITIFQDQPDHVQFRGSHAIENSFINQLFRFEKIQLNPFDYQSRDSILRFIRDDRKVLDSCRSKLNPVFVKRLGFELNYLEKQWELSNHFLFSVKQTGNSASDTLHDYKKFLGQTQYPESAAYREFVMNFVSASQKNAWVDNGNSDEGRYSSASTFLNGWDRYWALAKLTLDMLKDNDYDRERYYQSFMDEYGGTSFGSQLKDFYNSRRDAKTKIINMLDLEEFLGHPVLVSLNYEKSKNFIKRMVRDSGIHHNSGLVYLQYVPKSSYDKVLDELKLFSDHPRQTNPAVEIKFYPRILPDSLEYYLKDFNRDQELIILFDRDGNWASSLAAGYYYSGWIDNLLSWPQLTPTTPKTINLSTFWYSLAGAFFLTLILTAAIRLRSQRKEKRLTLKRKMAQLEVDAVRSRMNPHFLFNALSSIQNLINKKQIEEANLFLARFGDLVRTILSQSSKPAIGLNEEIDMIRNYLQLEQLRFPFTFDIQIDPALDLFAIEVPPLLIQPHVENAVMHGISALGKDGRIDVSFRAENQHLICEVKDNGPGYHPKTKTGNGGLGQGWRLTRQRIRLMKEQYGDDVSVEVKNLSDESDDGEGSSGTTVIFSLPMQKPSL